MPYVPTVREAVLVQRVSRGDVEALVELWDLWFDEPLDQSRRIEDIAKDLEAKVAELTAKDEKDEKPKPKPKPRSSDNQDAIISAMEASVALVNEVIEETKRKRESRLF